MAAPSFLTQKIGPLPVYAYGLALAGGAAVIVAVRRRSAGAGTAAGTSNPAGAADAGSLFGGGSGGGDPGTPSSDLTGPTQGGGGGSFLSGGDQGIGPPMPQQSAPSTASPNSFTPTSGSYYGTPDSPIYRSQPVPDIGATPAASITSISRIMNPGGTALGLSQQPQNIYTPSALDLASEQPGGVAAVQAAIPGSTGGQSYTIYSAPGVAGTGTPIPVAQRKAGERYDASGRVIL